MRTGRIFSVGHGGQSRKDVVARLRAANVGYLIDVRSSPYSAYQPDFSRVELEKSLSASEPKYVFMGDLLGGRPRDSSCYTEGKVDYAKVREKDFFVRGIERLKSAYRQGLSVCLICSEGQPSQCHRAKLVGAALAEDGIDVRHLMPDGSERSQSDVMLDITNGQNSLFQESFTSRKVYR
jgi:uncharacterized protein (DUF488 family)